MSNFRPLCTCTGCECGAVKNLALNHQNQYVMMFLMGLNESFTHTRIQVLLKDPIPLMNKVFALVSQEEKQQTFGGQSTPNFDSTNAFVMATKSDGKLKMNTKYHKSVLYVHTAISSDTHCTQSKNSLVTLPNHDTIPVVF